MHPESSGGAGISPGPPGEFGVAIPPDEHTENSLNLETLHSETGSAMILPEERSQQNLFSNDDPLYVTETDVPGVKEEVGVELLPVERESLGANRYASTSLLRVIPSTKSTGPGLFLRLSIRRFPLVPPH